MEELLRRQLLMLLLLLLLLLLLYCCEDGGRLRIGCGQQGGKVLETLRRAPLIDHGLEVELGLCRSGGEGALRSLLLLLLKFGRLKLKELSKSHSSKPSFKPTTTTYLLYIQEGICLLLLEEVGRLHVGTRTTGGLRRRALQQVLGIEAGCLVADAGRMHALRLGGDESALGLLS